MYEKTHTKLPHVIDANGKIPVKKVSLRLLYEAREKQGCVAQSVTCLTADPGVVSLIPARSHTLAEIDPSADSRRVVVSYKRKYVHEILVNRLVKLAKENSVVK